ncbi:PHA/PHB synthase family protein [Thiothrix subterranea]|uniref:Class I poly(R)-hydroxyalkanoic acid synthase n=1 Tax=Thiothrix subterranea TaxID=2735563 RepID=A0AA51MM10_9GAMM|nr:class I poly(R)-hydroxyalkanoic acid synthase [Thiothrix subterranea]MDQ5768925.1 class I poly(R)-hydroxyalkanoic acid synthase [Thiothrix subterranea]WML86159.1 class I poly(R)-hydroxyalkanoic acid synthase [Thiothrix subterranea]
MQQPVPTPTHTVDPVQLQTNITRAMLLWQRFVARMMSDAASKQGKDAGQGDNSFNTAIAKWGVNLFLHPTAVMQANMALLTSQTKLWQHSTARALGFGKLSPGVPAITDKRFKHPAWQEHQFTEVLLQSYLNMSTYWRTLAQTAGGLSEQDAKKAEFFINSMIDALSPNNYSHTNPQVWQTILDTNGENLVKGMENLLDDFQDGQLRIRMTDMKAFELGRDIATTPGKVVFKNELLELIQYTPSTAKVRQRPVLIVPPWINKYYILDLREKNSFVKWAVEQGNTVFMISWVNPDSQHRNLNFEDYMQAAIAAMDAVEAATGERDLNLIGYCLGGTLTAATLAHLKAKGDDRVKSATFFTTLLDFAEPGEIGVFLSEEQVGSLEKRMDKTGYLDGKDMGTAFNMLRANDLVWSFFVNLYLLGNDPMPFDLLYWNSDSTRMPAAMHSYYLRNMYLNNCLSQANCLTLSGTPIDLRTIDTPAYFVSTHDDHIAPWRSTYAGAKLFAGPVRFVLGQSGHIAGIVNPAAANKYGHWINDTQEKLDDTAEDWLLDATKVDLSWWHDWNRWVATFSSEEVDARVPGAGKLEVLGDAPGTYVRQKI